MVSKDENFASRVEAQIHGARTNGKLATGADFQDTAPKEQRCTIIPAKGWPFLGKVAYWQHTLFSCLAALKLSIE
jgi:hypothetical protein